MLKPSPHALCPAQRATPEFADRVVVAALRDFEITRRWSRVMQRVSLGIAAAWLTALLGVGWDFRVLAHESERREQDAMNLLEHRRTCGCLLLVQVEETSERVQAILDQLRDEDASHATQSCAARARPR
jgi:hypothetical protein